jgi:hypothetical protein
MTLRERFIAKANAPRVESVTPAFLGEPVDVCTLTLAERRDLLNSSQVDGEQDSALLQARTIIATVCDPETKAPVFTAADQDMLLGLPAVHLDELSAVGLKLNGLLLIAAKAEAEKNS